jgi:general secretion pathway protein D
MTAAAQTPPAPAPVAAPAPADDEMLTGIHLTDATIDHVLMLLESWTGKTILRPQQLPTPTFALNINRTIPKSEAILALETLLNLNGIAVVPSGDKFLKVIDLPRARMEAPQMIEGSTLDLPPSGQIASKLFQLQFQRVNEFLPQINMLLNGNMGGYVVFEKSNAALVTDSISNLQRIEMLVNKLDQPLTAGLTPKFFTVHNAKASDIVTKINSIVTGTLQSQLGSATHYSADDRTNQIVLLSDPRQYPFFQDLIEKLDVRADPNTRTEVIYLKHAQAKDVATLLSNLISGQSKAQQNSSSKPNVINTPNPLPPAPGQAPNPALANAITEAMGTTNEFSGLIDIQPDERSNAIVVSGVADDIRLIRDLISKVDVLLPQVRIEVVIAEVTLTDNESSGINSLGISVNGSRVTSISGNLAGINGGSDGSGGTLPVTATIEPVANGVVTNPGKHPLSLTAILSPLANRSNVQFLSAPTIVTIHNKESEIDVTNQQPIISSINQAAGYTNSPTTGTGVTTNPFNTSSSVTYKDIGIQLKVKALVGVDNSIQLDVDQIVDDVVDHLVVDGNSQPIIGHREAKSSVNVSSDEMIVLGGLQRNEKTVTKGKFGFLYPIPILGSLFGPRTHNIARTELLVFIRPHVIKPEENLIDTNRQIDQQSESDVIKAFINPDTRADPQKAAEKAKKERKKEEKQLKKEDKKSDGTTPPPAASR